MSHLLLIDDDASYRDMLQLTLVELGHQVTVATNGKEGLAAHLANPADLVITDLIMPEMEGIETIMEFKRRCPALPIIAMSGGGRCSASDYLSTARQLGARHTLIKPFSSDALRLTITASLQGG